MGITIMIVTEAKEENYPNRSLRQGMQARNPGVLPLVPGLNLQ